MTMSNPDDALDLNPKAMCRCDYSQTGVEHRGFDCVRYLRALVRRLSAPDSSAVLSEEEMPPRSSTGRAADFESAGPGSSPGAAVFLVIDTKTGAPVDMNALATEVAKADWADGLVYCDLEGFAVETDGTLVLLDECGKYAYPPDGRFVVKLSSPSRSEQQSQGGISDFSEAITEMQNDLVCMAFNALHVGRHGEVDQDTLDVLDAFVIPIERITEWRIADELADACAAVDCAKAKDHAAIIKGLQSQELRHLFTKDSAATPSAPTTKLGEASSQTRS